MGDSLKYLIMESNVVIDDLIEKYGTVNTLKKVKNKLRHHHVIPWSVLLSTRALNQSAREKSFNYCKIFYCCLQDIVYVYHMAGDKRPGTVALETISSSSR